MKPTVVLANEQMSDSVVSRVVNALCSCGGKGPTDPGVCGACLLYHRIEQDRAEIACLKAEKQVQDSELEVLRGIGANGWCQIDHEKIGFRATGSGLEPCPLCKARATIERLEHRIDRLLSGVECQYCQHSDCTLDWCECSNCKRPARHKKEGKND